MRDWAEKFEKLAAWNRAFARLPLLSCRRGVCLFCGIEHHPQVCDRCLRSGAHAMAVPVSHQGVEHAGRCYFCLCETAAVDTAAPGSAHWAHTCGPCFRLGANRHCLPTAARPPSWPLVVQLAALGVGWFAFYSGKKPESAA